jgi:hypothetical protein
MKGLAPEKELRYRRAYQQKKPSLSRRLMHKNMISLAVLLLASTLIPLMPPAHTATDNPNPPSTTVRLIFIHHSTGENWLADENGGLGLALRSNNYFVSDTNYDWGPDGIGSSTDIGQWWLWFRSPESPTYMSALYSENEQHASYTRLRQRQVSSENEIVMFKSCFPNSALMGDPNDPVPSIQDNPLRGEDSGSEYHTVANAKGIYIDLLEYFRTRPDKLFIVITAPPQSDPTYSSNARAFNQWLIEDWLQGYPYNNVFVFDFYNVLTTNGGSPNVNDWNGETGNHHRWWDDAIQHKIDGDNDDNPNVLEYPTEDDHPSRAGNIKATGEFLSLLNIAYNRWKSPEAPTTTTAQTNAPSTVVQSTMAETETETTALTVPTSQPFPPAILAIIVIVLVGVGAAVLYFRRTRR